MTVDDRFPRHFRGNARTMAGTRSEIIAGPVARLGDRLLPP